MVKKEKAEEIISEELDKEAQAVLADKGLVKNEETLNNRMPIGLKIVIGVLAVIILGLLGYIMYQVGKGSMMTDSKKDLIVGDGLVGDDKANEFTESNFNTNVVGDADSTTPGGGVAVADDSVAESNAKLSKEDMDRLSNDIDKLSDKDDEFKEVQDTFDKNL